MGDLGLQPFKRGGRKSSAPKAGDNGAEKARDGVRLRDSSSKPVSLPSDDETRKAITKYLGITRNSSGGRPRWSMERYIRGHRYLRDVLVNTGSNCKAKALPRPMLREEARKQVGDTGLLDHLLKHMVDLPYEGSIMRRHEGAGGLFGYWLEPCDRAHQVANSVLLNNIPSSNGGTNKSVDVYGARGLSALSSGGKATELATGDDGDDELAANLRPARQLHRLKRRGIDDEETDTENEGTPLNKWTRKRKRKENKALQARLLGKSSGPVEAPKTLRTVANARNVHEAPAPVTVDYRPQLAQLRANDTFNASLIQLRNEGAAQLKSIRSDMAAFKDAFVSMADVMKSIQVELKESNRILHSVIHQNPSTLTQQLQPQPTQVQTQQTQQTQQADVVNDGMPVVTPVDVPMVLPASQIMNG